MKIVTKSFRQALRRCFSAAVSFRLCFDKAAAPMCLLLTALYYEFQRCEYSEAD